jgi:hypothetical protein
LAHNICKYFLNSYPERDYSKIPFKKSRLSDSNISTLMPILLYFWFSFIIAENLSQREKFKSPPDIQISHNAISINKTHIPDKFLTPYQNQRKSIECWPGD